MHAGAVGSDVCVCHNICACKNLHRELVELVPLRANYTIRTDLANRFDLFKEKYFILIEIFGMNSVYSRKAKTAILEQSSHSN